MAKPETMCDETGCTRDWETTIMQGAAFSMTSTYSNSLLKKKVCLPCAEAHERNSKPRN